MVSLFKKSLDVKLAGCLLLVLCLTFLFLVFSFDKALTSRIGNTTNDVSGVLTQIDATKLSQDDAVKLTNASKMLAQLPQTISSQISSRTIATAVICIVIIMVLMGIVFQFIFSKPLKLIIKELEGAFRDGENNLTVRLNLKRDDEIGVLADCFDKFISSLDGVVAIVAGKTESVFASSSEIHMASETTDKQSTDLSERSNSVAAAAEEMNASMHTVAAASEEASTNITVVADAAGQMQSNINSVAVNCKEARKISNEALAQVETATGKVGLLGGAAKEISKVTQVITDIAEQTDLLALNATIEAARAGELGKGFAVVASEIKSLASQTAEATKNIREKIEGIQTSTNETVDEVGTISQVITHVNDIVTQIAEAIDEQSATATEVATNIEQASIGISEVNENVAQSSQVASEIASDIANVDEIASDMSGRTTAMAQNARDLDSLAASLREMIATFRISSGGEQQPATQKKHSQVADLIPWTSDLSLSIGEIDAHHKELVRMVNLLHRAMRQQKGASEAGRILNDLADYTVFHFGFEEDLFKKYQYPEYESHQKIHQELIAKVQAFKQEVESGKSTITLDLMTFLRDWLKNHIMKTDKAYAPFLIEKMKQA